TETGGNYTKAARILGISRMTLYNKIRAYGLNVKKIGSNDYPFGFGFKLFGFLEYLQAINARQL
ncbi:unnamed protein product, partial [marine sediment metagenome]